MSDNFVAKNPHRFCRYAAYETFDIAKANSTSKEHPQHCNNCGWYHIFAAPPPEPLNWVWESGAYL